MAISPDTGSSPRQLNFYQQVAIKLPCPPLAQDLVSTIRAQFPLPITRPRASISNLRSICLAYHSVSLANGSPKFQQLALNLRSFALPTTRFPLPIARPSFKDLRPICPAHHSPKNFSQQLALNLSRPPLAQELLSATWAQFTSPAARPGTSFNSLLSIYHWPKGLFQQLALNLPCPPHATRRNAETLRR